MFAGGGGGGGGADAGGRSGESAAAAPKPNTILGRLQKVLSSVRGGGGSKAGRPAESHTRFNPAVSAYDTLPMDPLGEGGLEVDRKVFDKALSQLHRSQPVSQRLEVLEGLSELVRVYKFADLPAMWACVRDLAEPGQPRLCMERAVTFMGALSWGDNFDRLGPLRLEFFSVVYRAHEMGDAMGLELELAALLHVTKNAQSCAPFEVETCRLIIAWLYSLSAMTDARPIPIETQQDLLSFSSAFVKENFANLVSAVCDVYASSGGVPPHEEGGVAGGKGTANGTGAVGEWNLGIGCLAFFDVVARYTVPPVDCLAMLTDVLCMAVNEPASSREAWAVMRNVLVGEQSLPMMNHLLSILHGEAPEIRGIGGVKERLRGAIFFVSNATWGSSRIEGMQHPRHSVLRALLPALNVQDPRICEEVLLSMKRLLGKFGAHLRFEWDIVFQILEKATMMVRHVQEMGGGGAFQAPHVAAKQEGKWGEAERPGAEKAVHVTTVLEMVEQLREAKCFHGVDSDFYRFVSVASSHAPKKLALEALSLVREHTHPAHSGWLQTAAGMMESFYVQDNDDEVRIRSLQAVWQLVSDYRAMYEEELVDSLVLPFLQPLPREPSETVWTFALRFLSELSRSVQCDRFSELLELLVRVANQGDTPAMRLSALRCLLSLFESTFTRIPPSRFLSVYSALLSFLKPVPPSATGRHQPPPQAVVEVISTLATLQASAQSRPILVRPATPAPAPAPSVTSPTGAPTPAPKASFLHCSSLLAIAQGDEEEGGGTSVIDVAPLFDALVGILEDAEAHREVVDAACQALLRGLENRVVFRGQNVARLAKLLMSKLQSGQWGADTATEAETPQGSSNWVGGAWGGGRGPKMGCVGYSLLSLVAAGWATELPEPLILSVNLCFVHRLRTTLAEARLVRGAVVPEMPQSAAAHAPGGDPDGSPSASELQDGASPMHALEATNAGPPGHRQPPSQASRAANQSNMSPAFFSGRGGNSPMSPSVSQSLKNLPSAYPAPPSPIGGRAAMENKAASFKGSPGPQVSPRGGGAGAGAGNPSLSSWPRIRPGIAEVTRVCIHALTVGSAIWQDLLHLHLPVVLEIMALLENDRENASLVMSCIQYTKFIAVQGDTYALSPALNEKYLRSLFSFSDQARWGGLVANLAMRSIALMYLQTKMPLRTRVARDLIPFLQERSNDPKRDDPISATMLDWILRHATSDLTSQGFSLVDPSDHIFDAPGTKSKTYAVGNSVISVRSSVLGLISIVCRRPTDLSRWIFMSPRSRMGKTSGDTVDGLLALLLSRMTVPDVDAVGQHGGPLTSPRGKGPTKVEAGRLAPEGDRVQHSPREEHQESGKEAAKEGDASGDGRGRGAAAGEGGGHKGGDARHEGFEERTPSGASGASAGERSQDDVVDPDPKGGNEQRGSEEALDPDVVLMQWRRGPFAEAGQESGPGTEELVDSAALQRALRLLDMTPLTFTHKFGIIYVGPSQEHEHEFLANTCGSSLFEEFLSSLGTHTSLALCGDDVFTGGLDRTSRKDGEFALLWGSSLAQCVFFVGTLMPNDAGEQINKKRFIGNTYVKIVYSDSDAPFTLDSLSGQFNLIVVLVRPLPNRYFRVSVLRAPTVPVLGPIEDTAVIPMKSLSLMVRRIVIDSDIAAMIAVAGERNYSSNWHDRLKQIRNMLKRHQAHPQAPPREV